MEVQEFTGVRHTNKTICSKHKAAKGSLVIPVSSSITFMWKRCMDEPPGCCGESQGQLRPRRCSLNCCAQPCRAFFVILGHREREKGRNRQAASGPHSALLPLSLCSKQGQLGQPKPLPNPGRPWVFAQRGEGARISS